MRRRRATAGRPAGSCDSRSYRAPPTDRGQHDTDAVKRRLVQTLPETGISAPVIAREAGAKRNTITSASASGDTQREKSAFGMSARLGGVSMMLGSTALTFTPWSLSSSARLSVRRATPAFEAAYGPMPAPASARSPPPCTSTSESTAPADAGARSSTPTRAPTARSARTTAWPSAPSPPVTATTFPFSTCSMAPPSCTSIAVGGVPHFHVADGLARFLAPGLGVALGLAHAVVHVRAGQLAPGAHDLLLLVAGEERVHLLLVVEQRDLLLLGELGDRAYALQRLRHPSQGLAHLLLVLRLDLGIEPARGHFLHDRVHDLRELVRLETARDRRVVGPGRHRGACKQQGEQHLHRFHDATSSAFGAARRAYSCGCRCQSPDFTSRCLAR